MLKDQTLGQVRHIMTILGGALGSYGFFATNDQQAQFVTIATGITVAGSAVAVSPGR